MPFVTELTLADPPVGSPKTVFIVSRERPRWKKVRVSMEAFSRPFLDFGEILDVEEGESSVYRNGPPVGVEVDEKARGSE